VLLPELATQRFPEVSTASAEGVLSTLLVKPLVGDAAIPDLLKRLRLLSVFATQMDPVPVTATAAGAFRPPPVKLLMEEPRKLKRTSEFAVLFADHTLPELSIVMPVPPPAYPELVETAAPLFVSSLSVLSLFTIQICCGLTVTVIADEVELAYAALPI
jgi:hypothetical protein